MDEGAVGQLARWRRVFAEIMVHLLDEEAGDALLLISRQDAEGEDFDVGCALGYLGLAIKEERTDTGIRLERCGNKGDWD